MLREFLAAFLGAALVHNPRGVLRLAIRLAVVTAVLLFIAFVLIVRATS